MTLKRMACPKTSSNQKMKTTVPGVRHILASFSIEALIVQDVNKKFAMLAVSTTSTKAGFALSAIK